MAEQEKKPGGTDGRKKKFHRGGFARGAMTGRSIYKSKVQGLENDTFDVGASSGPAKFSKLLKNFKNYIQKDPDDMMKTIQKMKKVSLSFPVRSKKNNEDCCDDNGDPDSDAFDMAAFAWKEDYKSMKLRMDKYKGHESNAWALIYHQCSLELKNKPHDFPHLVPNFEGVGFRSLTRTRNSIGPCSVCRRTHWRMADW